MCISLFLKCKILIFFVSLPHFHSEYTHKQMYTIESLISILLFTLKHQINNSLFNRQALFSKKNKIKISHRTQFLKYTHHMQDHTVKIRLIHIHIYTNFVPPICAIPHTHIHRIEKMRTMHNNSCYYFRFQASNSTHNAHNDFRSLLGEHHNTITMNKI